MSLGHPLGENCPCPSPRNITVIHTNGIHEVRVNFCGCRLGLELRIQLLRFGWWPATPLNPRSAATFTVLRQFQYLNLQGNITAYDFYRGLEFQTDGRLATDLPVGDSLNVCCNTNAENRLGEILCLDDNDPRVAQRQSVETCG